MKKFDYIVTNEDKELLWIGHGETKKQFDQNIKTIKKEQFERWGEHYPLVIYKSEKMEKVILTDNKKRS